MLDTQPVTSCTTQIPVILGRPFLATSNALINCRNGVMKLSFKNMTVDFNIFHVCKQPNDDNENEETQEVNLINSLIQDIVTPFLSSDPLEACLNHSKNIEENKEIREISTLLNSTPLMDTTRWQSRFEKLPRPINTLLPSKI